MSKIIYIDCFSGISGDMTIGALLDLGIDRNYLEEQLKLLHIEKEYDISLNRVIKNGISSNKFDVQYEENGHHHSHDHSAQHEHNHHHTHHHSEQDHGHDDHHHDHHHDHRTYQDIVAMIETSELNANVKQKALEMFRVIGEAEAKIHGMDLAKVHFHEVGAVDSIVDIVGVAILIDKLQVDKIIASPIPVGSGHIHIDHGTYPVPAPATLEVLRDVPIAHSSIKGELTTPTGAAIIKTLVSAFSTVPNMKVEKVGYGAGTKTFPDHPNVLRLILGEPV